MSGQKLSLNTVILSDESVSMIGDLSPWRAHKAYIIANGVVKDVDIDIDIQRNERVIALRCVALRCVDVDASTDKILEKAIS